MDLRYKRRFEYVKVISLSRYSTGLRALFLGDQMVMQPTMTTFPTLPTFPLLLFFFSFFFFSLWPQAPFASYSIYFLSQVILTETSVPPLHLFA